jgi:hypothetical protein
VEALFALRLTDPGYEVVLTDPTYAGMLNRVRLVWAVPRLAPLRVEDGEWRLDALHATVSKRARDLVRLPRPGPVASLLGRVRGRAVRRPPGPAPFGAPGHARPHRTVGAPSFEQRMIAWRVGRVVAPGELVNDVSRVHIYNGLVPSGFAQIGTRVALGAPDVDLAAQTPNGSDAETRRSASSTACPWCARPEAGRASSTSPHSGSTAPRSRTGYWPRSFVFSNEPVKRLAPLGPRVRAAIAPARRR